MLAEQFCVSVLSVDDEKMKDAVIDYYSDAGHFVDVYLIEDDRVILQFTDKSFVECTDSNKNYYIVDPKDAVKFIASLVNYMEPEHIIKMIAFVIDGDMPDEVKELLTTKGKKNVSKTI